MTAFLPDSPLIALDTNSTHRRYSTAALLPTTLKLAAQYHKHSLVAPAQYTPAAFASAERAVKRAAKVLASGTSSTTSKIVQRRRESALFYAVARRDALRLVLREIDPGSVPANGSTLAKRRPPGVAAKLARCRYHLKLQRNAEPSLVLDYQQARELMVAAQMKVDRAKAELYLALDEQEQTLLQRRVERGDKARRPRGSVVMVQALRDALKQTDRECVLLTRDARVLYQRLARCRTRIRALEANIVEIEAA